MRSSPRKRHHEPLRDGKRCRPPRVGFRSIEARPWFAALPHACGLTALLIALLSGLSYLEVARLSRQVAELDAYHRQQSAHLAEMRRRAQSDGGPAEQLSRLRREAALLDRLLEAFDRQTFGSLDGWSEYLADAAGAQAPEAASDIRSVARGHGAN